MCSCGCRGFSRGKGIPQSVLRSGGLSRGKGGGGGGYQAALFERRSTARELCFTASHPQSFPAAAKREGSAMVA